MNNKDHLLASNRVAIYIRVSTDEQVETGDSLRMQKEELTKWAEDNGYTVYDYYIDDGYTATTLNRPELQRMLNESDKFGLIIFIKLDRFSRGVGNYYKIMERLDKTNTNWKSIFEEYDTTTNQGRLMINLMLSIAENEAALVSERTKAVLKNKIENGECIFGNLPCGFKKETCTSGGKSKRIIVHDEDTKQIMIDAFNHMAKFGNLNLTCNYLREKHGYVRARSSLRVALKNRLYIGDYEHKQHGIFPGFCEPMVSNEVFYKVQETLSKNGRNYGTRNPNERPNQYIFSGFMNCPGCGGKLSSSCGRHKRSDGSVYKWKFYRCSRYTNSKTCPFHFRIGEMQIEKFLLENVRSLLEDKIVNFEVKKLEQKDNKENELNKQITQVEKRLLKLKDMYYDDKILKEHYESDFVTFNNQLTDLLNQKKNLKENKYEIDANFYKEFLNQNFETVYKELDEMERRRLWLSVIKEIVVDGKELHPVFY